jgi:hypothetical protein
MMDSDGLIEASTFRVGHSLTLVNQLTRRAAMAANAERIAASIGRDRKMLAAALAAEVHAN